MLAAVTDHLVARNVQRGGPYGRSQEVDAMIARAREAVAAFVNARAPSEIAFGLNATSFIRVDQPGGRADARRRGRKSSSPIWTTRPNIATWVALERVGARIVWWKVRDDGRLHVADLEPLLSRAHETRRVHHGVKCDRQAASTSRRVARLAHAVGAEVFLDAVHFGPHGPIDVQALDCDYLVCSGYKIFAPHMGFAWCRAEAINRLPTFREDFIPDVMPDKLEAGTYAYENVAGMDAAVAIRDIWRDLGRSLRRMRCRRPPDAVRAAMWPIADMSDTLSAAMLDAVDGHARRDRSRRDRPRPPAGARADALLHRRRPRSPRWPRAGRGGTSAFAAGTCTLRA